MHRSHLALLLMAGMMGYGMWRLFDLRFASGEIYPPYSSLRADAQGTRALYDSLSELPGYSVTRNYRPLEGIPKGKQTIFYLGISPESFEFTSDEELKPFEDLAAGGARVVIAFRRAGSEKSLKETPLHKRWHVTFSFLKKVTPDDHSTTALVFTEAGPEWRGDDVLERNFGAGSIVLLPLAYPLSNEALEQERDTELLASLIGNNRSIMFEENHLGVIESGSIAGLARKYHLEGLYAAALLLAGLFIWKNSTSLLPARETASHEAVATAKDSFSGLANLLRRNIASKDVIQVCLEQWEKARVRCSGTKRSRVHASARRVGDPVSAYREISKVLAQRE